MFKPSRRQFGRTFLATLALSACAFAAHAQGPVWPSKPITLSVGFAPGGSADIVARELGRKLTEVLGQPVVVDNKPGAGGTIAAAGVASAQADGHTLLLVTSGHAGSGALYSTLRYDPIKAFAPIAKLAATPVVIVVPSQQPWKTLPELLDAARKAPGKLNYAAGGGGATTTALAAEFLKSDTKTNMVQVPYRGSGPALTALLAGEVEVGFEIPSSALPHIQSGKLRPLAVTTRAKSGALPEVPTVIEQGVPNFEVMGWFGLLAPAGTPQPVLERLNREVNTILQQADMRKRLADLGMDAGGGTPQEFQKLIESDAKRYGEAIRRLGIQAN
ncbi:Bug family tripartite tricarboxylate transporter substrate binding protein [Hydrogenophaga sp. BPS33]|uniref:Bug family tripartite tricarboxylate transporter substrate binding protein n=1 Tax=Hydrogenophaga sp. BPS33 TaxID=2651974 RepID=UPI00131FF3CA|nr:tripartite tricarboxylate transporter substrate binding protein [Hydrogenophaga sp. BPS33]QHE86746.1 tripartite tricarboxylate transporter substrate binding protein [Hydrogenophaga sp. BPS33]